MNQENIYQLMDEKTPAPKVAPQFELRYEEEAKDHFVKVTEWLRATGMDAEWEIRLPGKNQLFLDFDVPASINIPTQYYTTLKTLTEAYNLSCSEITEEWTTSKSSNQHCVITLPERIVFSPMEAAAWQSAAGSDPKREALHMKSVVLGSKNPNLLIERKKVQKLLGA